MAYGYADNIFTAIIDENGDIYEASTGRKRQKVGVDSQREQELLGQIIEIQERLDNYYDKLVELGIIALPKGAEQIAQEAAEQQTALMAQMMETMKTMQDEIRGLKNGNVGSGDAISIQPKRQNSTGNRKTPGGSAGSDKSSAKDVAGDNE